MWRLRQRRRRHVVELVRADPTGRLLPGGRERCSDESNGRYKIDLELLPTDASQAREQLVRRLGAEDSTIDVVGMDVVWTAEFANAEWLGNSPSRRGAR